MPAEFTASVYEALSPGVYPAVLVGIERATSEQFGDFLKWSFLVRTTDGGEAPLSAVSSASTGPKSKAYKWATALLGRTPLPAQPEDLAGKTCQLHVVVNEEGFNRIESVLPLNPNQTTAFHAPAAPDAPIDRSVLSAPAASSDLPF